jgi:hypothetical protein
MSDPIIIGAYYRTVVQLYDAAGAFPVDSATRIQACLEGPDGCAAIAWADQSSTATGAAWASGQVAVEFSESQTLQLLPGRNRRIYVCATIDGRPEVWSVGGFVVDPMPRRTA